MTNHELPFLQDEGRINLPSTFYICGKRVMRRPTRPGPKPKGGRGDAR